jgi:pyruvate formate lyase activating enzyme
LGIDYPLKDVNPPSAERVENAKRILGEALKA